MNRTVNYVPAIRRREMPSMPIEAHVQHSIDVVPTATQHVEMRTSSVDQAKGFLISSVPLYAAFATAVVAVCVLGFGMPWLSLPTITVFLLAFVAVWFLGYTYTLQISPQGVSLFEAKAKWQILKEEQRRRWDSYEREWEEVNHD